MSQLAWTDAQRLAYDINLRFQDTADHTGVLGTFSDPVILAVIGIHGGVPIDTNEWSMPDLSRFGIWEVGVSFRFPDARYRWQSWYWNVGT